MVRLSLSILASIAFVLCTAIASPAQVAFNLIETFDGPNGLLPYYGGPLVQGTDGNFYGTTYEGGKFGHGTVFSITPGGTQNWVYSFCQQGPPCPDGDGPFEGLIQATDGNLYGTTFGGGQYGYGTVFKITLKGTWSPFYSFCQQGPPCPDGASPAAGLMQGTDQNFYGTTSSGGPYQTNDGTVFQLTPAGTLMTLHGFIGTDGSDPVGALTQGVDGNLYGTTSLGGANNCGVSSGCGTIFRVSTQGLYFKTLYSFGGADGDEPHGALVQAADGNLYGTTSTGGSDGGGTIFRITPAGTLTTLNNLQGPEGTGSFAGLVQATNGNLYGTASSAGAHNAGTIFTVSTVGTLNPLYSFCADSGCTDGSGPYSGLVQATSGIFYGTTSGQAGPGTVFSLSPGTATTTTVVSSLSSVAVNQNVILTATVTGSGGVPTGTVTFVKKGTIVLGTVALSSGQAILNESFAGPNTKDISAIYSGDMNFAPSTSPILHEGVGGDPTSTTLVSGPNPSVVGQPDTLTATVSSTFGMPTGTVAFVKDGITIGTLPLSGGVVILNHTYFDPWPKFIFAVYSGDANFAGSTSSTLTHVVNQATTTTTVTSSPNPSIVGQSVTFTVTVAPQFAGKLPAGTVTFMEGTDAIGTVTLTGGQAIFSKVFGTPGTKSITAIYSGSINFFASTSPALSQVVN